MYPYTCTLTSLFIFSGVFIAIIALVSKCEDVYIIYDMATREIFPNSFFILECLMKITPDINYSMYNVCANTALLCIKKSLIGTQI